jgi:hypothetical protein
MAGLAPATVTIGVGGTTVLFTSRSSQYQNQQLLDF